MELRALPASPVPADFLDGCETLVGAIEELSARYPDYECLTVLERGGGELRTSLGLLWRRAKATQSLLEARGLRPGDHAVLILPTGADLVSAYFGVMLAGGVPALKAGPSHRIADPSLYVDFLGRVFRNSGARFVLTEGEVASLLRQASEESLGGAVVVSADEISDLSPRSFSPTRPTQPDAIATIQYSSGTTGVPKGVMLSHRAMLAYMRALRDGARFGPEDVHVNWIPLYHDMGLFGAFLMPLLCGSRAVLIPTMEFLRDPSLWLWAIHAYRGTISWAPNFAYSLCAKRIEDEEVQGLDLSSWRVAVSASEPVLADTVNAFAKRFSSWAYRAETMTPSWGMAETVMAVALHPVSERPTVDHVDRDKLARDIAEPVAGDGADVMAVGRPLSGVELEIRDPDTRAPLPDRRVGILWVRAHCLFDGYQNDPERTAAVKIDNWFDTGDRAYRVGEDLYFVSREKDLVVIGGEKYAPHDVESIINSVPGVREGCSVAFGVTNPGSGTEDLGAVAETKVEGEEALAALRSAIRMQVSRTIGLGIRHLHLVPPGGIEKTTSGKLARAATRDRYPEIFGGSHER